MAPAWICHVYSFVFLRTSSIFWKIERQKYWVHKPHSNLTKLWLLFFFFFFRAFAQWQIVAIKTFFIRTLGKREERSLSLKRWVGRGLAWQLSEQLYKYETILLLEERMEKSSVASSAVLFFFISPFCFDAQWSYYNAAITKLQILLSPPYTILK